MALSDAVGCTLKQGGIFGTDSRGVWLKHAVGVNVHSGFTCVFFAAVVYTLISKLWLSSGTRPGISHCFSM